MEWKTLSNTVTAAAISEQTSGWVATKPRLAVLPDDRMMCVYEFTDPTGTNSRIHYTLFNGQTWQPGSISTFVDTAGVTTAASAPCVAISSLGKAICVYAKGNTADAAKHVYASEWEGTQWSSMKGGAFLDSTGNSISALMPKIAFDQLNNAICVFQQWDSTKRYIRAYANYFQGPPQVTSVTPSSGKNNEYVTLTVRGFNFMDGACVWLTRAEQSNISGENINVKLDANLSIARSFTADFNLTDAAVGEWSLVVRNLDGQQYTAVDIFGITWPDLKRAHVYPNPIRPGVGGSQSAQVLRFNNLTQNATIRIFNLKGVLLKTITKNDRLMYTPWDLRNEAGNQVAPGVYVYRIDSPEGSVSKGKFMVIR